MNLYLFGIALSDNLTVIQERIFSQLYIISLFKIRSSCYATLTSDSSSSDEEENFVLRRADQNRKPTTANRELRIGLKGCIKTMPVQPAATNSGLKEYHSINTQVSTFPVIDD